MGEAVPSSEGGAGPTTAGGAALSCSFSLSRYHRMRTAWSLRPGICSAIWFQRLPPSSPRNFAIAASSSALQCSGMLRSTGRVVLSSSSCESPVEWRLQCTCGATWAGHRFGTCRSAAEGDEGGPRPGGSSPCLRAGGSGYARRRPSGLGALLLSAAILGRASAPPGYIYPHLHPTSCHASSAAAAVAASAQRLRGQRLLATASPPRASEGVRRRVTDLHTKFMSA